MITVKNIHGTGENSGDWLKRWKMKNGYNSSSAIRCCVCGCGHTATDGAHVIVDGRGMRQFIVPMCHSHNLTYDVGLRAYDWSNPMSVVQ